VIHSGLVLFPRQWCAADHARLPAGDGVRLASRWSTAHWCGACTSGSLWITGAYPPHYPPRCLPNACGTAAVPPGRWRWYRRRV